MPEIKTIPDMDAGLYIMQISLYFTYLPKLCLSYELPKGPNFSHFFASLAFIGAQIMATKNRTSTNLSLKDNNINQKLSTTPRLLRTFFHIIILITYPRWIFKIY